MSCPVTDDVSAHLKGPIAWMAPETFDEDEKGRVVSPASDVYMLGSCFVEVATGCERQPFDWLSPQRCFLFRGNDDTRGVNCIQVMVGTGLRLGVAGPWLPIKYPVAGAFLTRFFRLRRLEL